MYLEITPSNKTTCQICNKPIAKGKLRLKDIRQFGMWISWRYFHPICFHKTLTKMLCNKKVGAI